MLDDRADPTRALRDTFGAFATGVTVITYEDERGSASAITVSSFASLSLDPPLIMFAVGKEKPSAACLAEGAHFTVNVLGVGQADLAWQCAKPAPDKLVGVDKVTGQNGLPRVAGAIAHVECRLAQTKAAGDHLILIGEVLCHEASDGDPLLFFRGDMREVAPCETATDNRI